MKNCNTNHIKQLSINEGNGFKLYFYLFLTFNCISFFIMILCFCILFYYKSGPYHELYLYQMKKLQEHHSNIDTIFLGDSSLGNAINADLFNSLSGLKSANLALTGLYGFAGSYNMLKKAVKMNRIKNVILIHTLGTISRPVAYDGYLYSMESLTDITELSINEKIDLLETSINQLFSMNNTKRIILYYILQRIKKYTIEKDYIKQTIRAKLKKRMHNLTIQINHDKLIFLKRIVEFCEQHKINLLYLHGPHLNNIDSQSKKDIRTMNLLIESTGIKIIDNHYFLTPDQTGDALDHVHPDYKDMITDLYYNDIKHDLVY